MINFMKEIRKVVKIFDKLGRVVIPKEIREKFQLNTNNKIKIFVNKDKIYLKKYQESCFFCGKTKNLEEFKGKYICNECKKEISELTNKKDEE